MCRTINQRDRESEIEREIERESESARETETETESCYGNNPRWPPNKRSYSPFVSKVLYASLIRLLK